MITLCTCWVMVNMVRKDMEVSEFVYALIFTGILDVLVVLSTVGAIVNTVSANLGGC